MNKTININLGGFFFHIDETAFLVLKKYLDSIANSLSDDPQGKDEIIADIEARISEILSEKITDERQVVNENDINDIIKIMGQPEDYVAFDDEYAEQKVFNNRTSNTKKLFRDGEDKFLGGVASGIGHYFAIDAIWVRLAFLVMTIFGGFGLPIYIVLWILLPEAKTTAEKLQMAGEAVTIENIEKKIRTAIDNVDDKIKNADYSKAKTGFQDFLDTIGKIVLGLFKVVGKFIGAILMFISVIVLISVVIGGFSWGSVEVIGLSDDFLDIPSFFYNSILPGWLITIAFVIAIGIPFVVLFVLGLRILSSKVSQFSRTASLTLTGIWIIAIFSLLFTLIEHQSKNAFDGTQVTEETYTSQKTDTLRLKVVNDDNLNYQHFLRRSTNKEVVIIDDVKKVYSNNVTIDVKKSNTDEVTVVVRKLSEGKNKKEANESSEKLEYNYRINDNVIELNAYFISDLANRYKDEKIAIVIRIPEETSIYFGTSVKTFIYDIQNTERILDSDMINHYFTMTEKGLNCNDCNLESF
jgi:phage shock protein PspC (stress-responsive transcriptional regulator)